MEPSKRLASAQDDACATQLPDSLLGRLTRDFPSHRLIRVADYSPEDVAAERRYHEGNECLGVAIGDFDGDKSIDIAFLLVSTEKPTFLVAARSNGKERWVLDKLWDLGNTSPGHIYVNVIDPGSYEDIFSEPPGDFPGWVAKHTSANQGIISGGIEASGVGFFFTGKGWVHLWLAD